jgi:hypothetical protein
MEYTPKVGDKVRATLGENVLVGGVNDTDGFTWLDIRFSDESTAVATLYIGDGWRIEPMLELPTLPGAVIECEGRIYARGAFHWVGIWPVFDDRWQRDDYFTGKQFIVHFAGVQR